MAWLSMLLKQIRLFAGDEIPEWLELEPSRLASSNLLPRGLSARTVNLHWRTDLGQQLGVAAPVHRDKPPSGFINCVSDGQ